VDASAPGDVGSLVAQRRFPSSSRPIRHAVRRFVVGRDRIASAWRGLDAQQEIFAWLKITPTSLRFVSPSVRPY